MVDERISAVAALWNLHLQAAFPARLRNACIAGVEMVMLDADVAGCVTAWLGAGGVLDDRRRDVLRASRQQLAEVNSAVTGNEATYFTRLMDVVVL